jgi:uncharacterized protein (DUF1778 family)
MPSHTLKQPRVASIKSHTMLSKRLDLRVAEEEKREIDQAAALTGVTTSGFVRQTVLTAARETIRTYTTLRLTREGASQFVAAINNPPPPNEHLRALVRELSDNAEQ